LISPIKPRKWKNNITPEARNQQGRFSVFLVEAFFPFIYSQCFLFFSVLLFTTTSQALDQTELTTVQTSQTRDFKLTMLLTHEEISQQTIPVYRIHNLIVTRPRVSQFSIMLNLPHIFKTASPSTFVSFSITLLLMFWFNSFDNDNHDDKQAKARRQPQTIL
jgi:hypothetical protein